MYKEDKSEATKLELYAPTMQDATERWVLAFI